MLLLSNSSAAEDEGVAEDVTSMVQMRMDLQALCQSRRQSRCNYPAVALLLQAIPLQRALARLRKVVRARKHSQGGQSSTEETSWQSSQIIRC